MSTHLSHRLPWESLSKVIAKKTRRKGKGNHRTKLEDKDLKVVYHFCSCLARAIEDFAATDKTEGEEKTKRDPKTWGLHETERSDGEHGYYDTILEGYIEMNLLLVDRRTFLPLMVRYGLVFTKAMYVMGGYGSPSNGNHPAWIAEHLRLAFEEFEEELNGRMRVTRTLKPMDAEVMQLLFDHCSMLFRCMFCVSEENKFCDPGFVGYLIAERFDFYWEFENWMVEN
ncbi:hypothetical protein Gpo141_00013790, partial [Globisporangium polare]